MQVMQDSIFTKIINGDLPSYKIYEDELTFAFLNIQAIQPGHMLVVPKAQVNHLEDLEDEDYQALTATVKKLMLHMRDILQVERVCMQVEGFEVPHAHIHLIPCNTPTDFKSPAYDVPEAELQDMHERLMF